MSQVMFQDDPDREYLLPHGDKSELEWEIEDNYQASSEEGAAGDEYVQITVCMRSMTMAMMTIDKPEYSM